MLVVADSSPIIVLVQLGHASILPSMFEQVLIPPQVSDELRLSNRPEVVRTFINSPPGWLVERAPSSLQSIPALHAGELAAISLAQEVSADLILIDEARGRKVAIERGISVTGTIGLLEQAARRGQLDLAGAFEKVKATDFWISPELLDLRLEQFRRGS